jgi:hypothetical protein
MIIILNEMSHINSGLVSYRATAAGPSIDLGAGVDARMEISAIRSAKGIS